MRLVPHGALCAAWSMAAALLLAACQPIRPGVGCAIEGPEDRVPAQVRQIRLGMTQAELESVLGPADHSPTEGQYYFSTGGDCPLGSDGHVASCGVVASFGKADESERPGRLESCWWGAIGE